MTQTAKDIVYMDYPIVKETTPQGELKTYENSDALAQAVKIWLVSSQGEKIRSKSGGYLMPFIGKPLDEDNARRISQRLIQGLSEDFNPPITVVDINVYPDTAQMRWVISIKGYNADLNIGVNTVVVVNNR